MGRQKGNEREGERERESELFFANIINHRLHKVIEEGQTNRLYFISGIGVLQN